MMPSEQKPNPFANNYLLKTKLYAPQTMSKTISRPRLFNLLDKGRQAKVIFVSAPSGFGKTTLVLDWVSKQDVHTGWLSLAEEDNDLMRFWTYVVAAIDCVIPGFMQANEQTCYSFHPSDYETGVTMLINELFRLESPLLLCLDDFHVITDQTILSSLSYFIEYLPPNVHLIAASRKELPFPAAKWRSLGHLLLLKANDLRFNVQEGIDFFRQSAELELSDEKVEWFVQRTEGWITAMKLIGLSLHGSGNASTLLRDLRGDFRLLEQYLLEEVFSQQSAQLQAFMLDCSILGRMNSSLCEALTGHPNGQELLDFMEHSGLFLVPLDEHRKWYRFHHLFADFLLQRLRKSNPDKLKELHLAAGRWCADHEWREEAVEYFLREQFFDEAVRVLEEMKSGMGYVSKSTLRSWFEIFPEEVLWKYPFLYFSYAYAVRSDSELAEHLLTRAEKTFEANAHQWTERERDHFQGALYFVRGVKAGQFDANLEQAVTYLTLAKQFTSPISQMIFYQLPVSHTLVKGEGGEAPGQLTKENLLPFMNDMIALTEEAGVSGSSYIVLGEFFYEWNDLEQAEAYIDSGMSRADFQSPVSHEILVPGWLMLSRIKKAQGYRQLAKETLLHAKRNIIDLGIPLAVIYFETDLARLALEDGDLSEAEAWQKKYRLHFNDLIPVNKLYEYKFLVRVLTAQGKWPEALLLCEKLIALCKRSRRRMESGEVYILQALLYQRLGETAQALEKLTRALAITEPEQFVRSYVDEGAAMAELLSLLIQSRAKQTMYEGVSLGYIRSILAYIGSGQGGGKPASLLVNLLTKRELDIYTLIAQGLTNKEIAEQLYIGAATVKTHVNNIYGKLGLKNRTEAILRSREFQGRS